MEESPIKKPSLAACLIVRNEAHTLEACLRGLENEVDAIYVTDTGSTDSTIEIARDCGAVVRTFQWQDNFAAARNASIPAVEEDWILIIDADDRFPPGQAGLLRGQLAADVCAATLRYAAVPGYTPVRAARLFRNGLGAAFDGRIHENLEDWIQAKRAKGWSLRHLDIDLQHTGYTAEAMPQKLARNLHLLESEWSDLRNSSDANRRSFIAAELGNALAKSHRHTEAVALLRRCLEESQSSAGKMPLASLQVLITLLWTLNESGRAMEALDLIRDLESSFAGEPAYALHRGLHELGAGNFTAARTFLSTFHDSWDAGDFAVPVPTEYVGAGWWRAMGLCYMGERHYSKAVDCFEYCCDLEPGNPEHQLRRLVAGRMVRL